jgi:hypothetical protein
MGDSIVSEKVSMFKVRQLTAEMGTLTNRVDMLTSEWKVAPAQTKESYKTILTYYETLLKEKVEELWFYVARI